MDEHYKLSVEQFRNLAYRYLKMEDGHIQSVLRYTTVENMNVLLNKTTELALYMKENITKIKQPAEYCIKALLDVLK